MTRNIFKQRRRDVLFKDDKSFKKSWDEKIVKLCEKINSLENYYTTSSCSGRIVLMVNQDKKDRNLFFKVYHDLISFDELKNDLNIIIKQNEKSIKFKLDPCALHIACKRLEDAEDLCNKTKLAGWKECGLISFKNKIVELKSTEKLEFPIIDRDKILVNDEFLKIIVDESNKKLKKSWMKIEKLSNLLE